jgi:O-antigen/teichoic acid export membrane protein
MKLAKNISIFTFFNLLNAGIPFLLLPLLTTYLSPSDYGIIDIFGSLVMVFTPIVGLSILSSLNRYYFEKETIDFNVFVHTVFLSLLRYGLTFIVVVSALGVFFGDTLSEEANVPPIVVILAVLYVFFSQISEILLLIWRISYRTVWYGIFRVSKTALDIGLTLYLIIILDYNWEGRIVPQLVVAALFGLIAISILRRQGFILNRLKYNKDYNRKALDFGVPLIFHSLSGYVIAVSDRFFILYFLGLESTGIYGVAYQIGMVVGLFQNSFNQAWLPYFFGSLKKNSPEAKLRIVKITYFYFVALLLIVVFFYFITPYIYYYLIGESFQKGIEVVIWVLLGYAFNGMYKMVVNYLFYSKETKAIAWCTGFSAFLNLVLNYFLINLNGIKGAAQATALSFLFLFLVVLILSSKRHKIPWNLKLDK